MTARCDAERQTDCPACDGDQCEACDHNGWVITLCDGWRYDGVWWCSNPKCEVEE